MGGRKEGRMGGVEAEEVVPARQPSIDGDRGRRSAPETSQRQWEGGGEVEGWGWGVEISVPLFSPVPFETTARQREEDPCCCFFYFIFIAMLLVFVKEQLTVRY